VIAALAYVSGPEISEIEQLLARNDGPFHENKPSK
jgi:hypothetical protein